MSTHGCPLFSGRGQIPLTLTKQVGVTTFRGPLSSSFPITSTTVRTCHLFSRPILTLAIDLCFPLAPFYFISSHRVSSTLRLSGFSLPDLQRAGDHLNLRIRTRLEAARLHTLHNAWACCVYTSSLIIPWTIFRWIHCRRDFSFECKASLPATRFPVILPISYSLPIH